MLPAGLLVMSKNRLAQDDLLKVGRVISGAVLEKPQAVILFTMPDDNIVPLCSRVCVCYFSPW